MPSSLSSPSDFDKIASFHQPIAANGLYWTAPIPDDALTLSADGKSASVEVRDYRVVDQPKFPKPGPDYHASLDFRITWRAEGRLIPYTQPKLKYSLEFYRAHAQIEYTARIPSRNLVITSAPLRTSDSVFAVMGRERNGSFFR